MRLDNREKEIFERLERRLVDEKIDFTHARIQKYISKYLLEELGCENIEKIDVEKYVLTLKVRANNFGNLSYWPIDLYLKLKNGEEYLFEIKTGKYIPNEVIDGKVTKMSIARLIKENEISDSAYLVFVLTDDTYKNTLEYLLNKKDLDIIVYVPSYIKWVKDYKRAKELLESSIIYKRVYDGWKCERGKII